MGLDLKSLVEKEQLSLELYEKNRRKRIAVDASHLLYTFLFTYRDTEGFLFMNSMKTHVTSHIYGLFRYLKSSKLSLDNFIFIFDGCPPIEKKGEIEKRRERKIDTQRKLELAIELNDINKIALYRRLTLEITIDIINDFKRILEVLGIPYIQAASEADFIISKLYKEEKIWAAASQDRDLLLHGVSYLIDPIDGTCISLNTLLNKLSWNQEQLITYGILLGTDYPGKAKGFGAITGKKLISKASPENPFETLIPPKNITLPSKEEFDNTFNLFKNGYQKYGFGEEVNSERDLIELFNLLTLYEIKSEEIISFLSAL